VRAAWCLAGAYSASWHPAPDVCPASKAACISDKALSGGTDLVAAWAAARARAGRAGARRARRAATGRACCCRTCSRTAARVTPRARRGTSASAGPSTSCRRVRRPRRPGPRSYRHMGWRGVEDSLVVPTSASVQATSVNAVMQARCACMQGRDTCARIVT